MMRKNIFIAMLKFSCVLDVQISSFPQIPKSLLTPNQLQDSSQTLLSPNLNLCYHFLQTISVTSTASFNDFLNWDGKKWALLGIIAYSQKRKSALPDGATNPNNSKDL